MLSSSIIHSTLSMMIGEGRGVRGLLIAVKRAAGGMNFDMDRVDGSTKQLTG